MTGRVEVLADAVRTLPGAWTTARARRDLRLLARRGLLTALASDDATRYIRRETA